MKYYIGQSGLILLFLQIFFVAINAQDNPTTVESLSDEPDSTAERGLSFNGYPYAYYTPETQLAFGAGGILIFYTRGSEKVSPSKITFGGYYTTSSQYSVSINPVLYFIDDKLYISAPASFGHFVDKFWGIGNETPDLGSEDYTRDGLTASLTVQVPPLWFAADRTGLIFEYDYTDVSDKKSNELLLNDMVIGSNGGTVYGFGTDLVWDSRDNLFFPNSGTYQYLKMIFYPGMGDFVFYLFELDLRHYSAISPDHVFAGNLYLATAGDEVPFYKMPALGGQNRMRGYFHGRYRDNSYLMFQLEYRQYFWWKFGFVVFAGAGDVAPILTKYQIKTLKYSYGAGLRFLFNKEDKVNLRMDIGFGNDGSSGIYFGLEEAF